MNDLRVRPRPADHRAPSDRAAAAVRRRSPEPASAAPFREARVAGRMSFARGLGVGAAVLAVTLLAALPLSAPARADAEASKPALPFGSHKQPYAAGILKPSVGQKAADQATAAFYDAWKARYLVEGCRADEIRVRAKTFSGAYVVSEGQGYGMLAVVMMAGHDPKARALFDGLVRYNRRHPSENDPRLLAWAQDVDCMDIMGPASATDGDLDIAYALLLADRQWGSGGKIDYAAEARSVIAAIKAKTVNPKTRLTMLGDWVVQASSYYYGSRSSDWMLGHFRAFAKGKGGAEWRKVVAAHEAVIGRLQAKFAPKTGLLPDFVVKTNTAPRPAPPGYLEQESDGTYSWNACRTPWRIGIDAAITGKAAARDAVIRMSRWIEAETNGNPRLIANGYSLAGKVTENGNSLAFVAPFAVGAMVDPKGQRWLDALWSDITRRGPTEYYGDSIKLLSMLAVSRNWLVP